jgi:hypothetical protein
MVTSVGFWWWCISINWIVFMDFIHRPVSQDQKTKIIDKKTKKLNRSNNKTSTYKSQKDQITNHRATNLDTHINTWSQKTQVAKIDTPTHKSQTQKDQNTNTEQQTWKHTHIHIDLEHTRDNKMTEHFGNWFCFHLQVKTCKGDLLSYRYPRSGWDNRRYWRKLQ